MPPFSLRLPASAPRQRPAELLYAADERPPNGALALLGIQHAGTALATALQARGGRTGACALLVHMPNPFMITIVAARVAALGPEAITSATLLI